MTAACRRLDLPQHVPARATRSCGVPLSRRDAGGYRVPGLRKYQPGSTLKLIAAMPLSTRTGATDAEIASRTGGGTQLNTPWQMM